LTLQAKENLQNYIYKSRPVASSSTTTTVYGDLSLGSRCQCDQYPGSRTGRSKSRYPASSLAGVAVRGRSKSRSRQSTINQGLDTIWPDSRGAWLPVWYFGKIKRLEAEKKLLLGQNEHGAFLIRDSESRRNDFSLSVKDGDTVKHYLDQTDIDDQVYDAASKHLGNAREMTVDMMGKVTSIDYKEHLNT